MCTGREIFVGLSTRTNMLGAQSVGRAFPEYPTTIVHVNPPAIHLKDYISMAGPEVMTVGKSEAAQRTFRVSPHWHSHSSVLNLTEVVFIVCLFLISYQSQLALLSPTVL